MPRLRKYGQRYPWRKWFMRRRLILTFGKEYFCRADVFAQMLRAAAKRQRPRKRVSIAISEDGKSMQVTMLREDE